MKEISQTHAAEIQLLQAEIERNVANTLSMIEMSVDTTMTTIDTIYQRANNRLDDLTNQLDGVLEVT